MKKKWICLLAALSLAIGVVAVNPALSAAATPLDLTREDCSLTINPEDPNKKDEDKFGEDLRSSGVVVDVYRVAEAVKTPGYDSYTYELNEAYKDLPLTENPTTADEWQKLAQAAAAVVLGPMDADGSFQGPAEDAELELVASNVDIAKIDEVKPNSNVVSELETGLYLLIAHGRDLTDPSAYATQIKQTVKVDETETTITKTATIANSARYQYTFEPQLVSIPGRPDAGSGDSTGGGTANRGEWQYDMTVNLKPQRSQRYGDLEIVKSLLTYDNTKDSPLFVFEVVGTLDNQEVYREYESITFTAAGQETVRLTGIPATAAVTVTEIYNGAGYRLDVSSEAVQDGIVIGADSVVSTAPFVNTSDDERKGGHGIRNNFTYDEGTQENRSDSGWQWRPTPAQGTITETPQNPN